MSTDPLKALADALAMRPALGDVQRRQKDVLAQLDEPFQSRNALDAWTVDAYAAAVGRVPQGLVDLLSSPLYAPITRGLLLDKGKEGARYRSRLRLILAAVYARAMEDLSRSTGEIVPGQGVARATATDRFAPTTYR